MSYASSRKILKQLEQRTHINKNLRAHMWRHTRATELAEYLTDAQRCQYFGWVPGSGMVRIYTHLVDTDNVILELNGIIKKEKDRDGKFTYSVCPRCTTKNPWGAKTCHNCSLGLDIKSTLEFDQQKSKTNAEIQTLKDEVEEQKKQIMSFKQEITEMLGSKFFKDETKPVIETYRLPNGEKVTVRDGPADFDVDKMLTRYVQNKKNMEEIMKIGLDAWSKRKLQDFS